MVINYLFFLPIVNTITAMNNPLYWLIILINSSAIEVAIYIIYFILIYKLTQK